MSIPFDDFDDVPAERWAELLERAERAYERAHAPYSDHPVGAALLTISGEVFEGCNVENVSNAASVCAERNAVGNAVTHGHSNFAALCVVSPDSPAAPCGICRQVLVEFGDELPILAADATGNWR
ncbi:MAG: cytidine deaminase, partial [Bradymonadaceae bacterium]